MPHLRWAIGLEPHDDLAEVAALLPAFERRGNLVDRKVAGNRRPEAVKLHRPDHGFEPGATARRRDVQGRRDETCRPALSRIERVKVSPPATLTDPSAPPTRASTRFGQSDASPSVRTSQTPELAQPWFVTRSTNHGDGAGTAGAGKLQRRRRYAAGSLHQHRFAGAPCRSGRANSRR
jgi:hypothetical protein